MDFSNSNITRGIVGLAFGSALLLSVASPALAQTETVLYSFCYQSGCADGTDPYAGLVMDSKGNLYGTTVKGGAYGYGAVFTFSASGVETVLHSFGSQSGDGTYPYGGLVIGKNGNLYGTTQEGGAYSQGTVFKISRKGAETVLYSFGSQSGDGARPFAGLIMDKQGNLYGTTAHGGGNNYGTVFKLSASGVETVLHSFGSQSGDGAYPWGGLIMDKQGNLYGTTGGGGAYVYYGTVFGLNTGGVETILHSFNYDGTDGNTPQCTLTMDKKGNLYGTTVSGGANDYGTIFEVSATGVETILHSFNSDGIDGYSPLAGLVRDKKGNLYGTTNVGGATSRGAVFEFSADGVETILHSFSYSDGNYPDAGLMMDKTGNLYSTTSSGGTYQNGTIFKVTP